MLSINLDNGTSGGPPRRHRSPFLVIWGHSGAWSTLAAGTGAFWVPKVIVCRPNTMPYSVVTFFPGFGTPVALDPARGPEGLACLLLACLLDAQAPLQWSNNLINWLKYYVLQLGDPNQVGARS